jgi:hypothetical protein
MKLVVDNNLKPFVNNAKLYNLFLEEIYRLQGEIRVLRSLMRLRDKVNG